MQIADFFLSAVVVYLAFDWLTAELVVFGITKEARFAETRSGMIFSPAFSITTTKY
jgi:hypothetical protein